MTTATKTATTVDPLAHIVGGGQMTDAEMRKLNENRETSACGSSSAGEEVVGEPGDWTCSRGEHPDNWKHIATYGGQAVIATWGGWEEGAETGDEAVAAAEPEIGALLKFRNRPTILMPVGLRGEDQVEVLDLTHQRFRLLKREQLVPRPADAEPPSAEMLAWVAKFMAERREETRRVARQQRRDGYFKTTEDLNQVLNELGLAPFGTIRRGTISLIWDVETAMTSAEVREKLKAWAKTLEMPPGVTMTTGPARPDASLRTEEM